MEDNAALNVVFLDPPWLNSGAMRRHPQYIV